ncbi:MAG: hypothetical protein WB812_00405 [Woeseiaceae bacterium]
MAEPTTLQQGDALAIVDVQRDFLPGGSLGASTVRLRNLDVAA